MHIKTLFDEFSYDEDLLNLFSDVIRQLGTGVTNEIEFNKILDNYQGNDPLFTTILKQYKNPRQYSSGVGPC